MSKLELGDMTTCQKNHLNKLNIDFLHRRMKRKKRTSLHLPQL